MQSRLVALRLIYLGPVKEALEDLWTIIPRSVCCATGWRFGLKIFTELELAYRSLQEGSGNSNI